MKNWSPGRKLAVAWLSPFVGGTPVILLSHWAAQRWEFRGYVGAVLLLAMIATGAILLARLPGPVGDRAVLIVCYIFIMPIVLTFYGLYLVGFAFGHGL